MLMLVVGVPGFGDPAAGVTVSIDAQQPHEIGSEGNPKSGGLGLEVSARVVCIARCYQDLAEQTFACRS